MIVNTPEEMTPEWFTAVVNGTKGNDSAKVTDVELERVEGGIIARMVRARLTYNVPDSGPRNVVVKYASDDEGSFGLAQAMGMYELEVRFYQDIAALVPDMSTPGCYLAQLDEATGRFVLVLEDRGANTKPGDVLKPASTDECSAVLNELTKFQAPLWDSPKIHKFDWLNDPSRTLGVFDSLPQGLQPFLDRFGHGLDIEHVRLFESVLPKAGQWVRSWTPPTVIQHGDFRSDNFLFGTNDQVQPVTVIDFQTIRPGPPGVDPAYFLGSSLGTEDRRTAERDLISEYHARLVKSGVEGYDLDQCWRSYRNGAMYGVFLFVGMASQVESTERGDQLIVDQIRRYADMALDLEAPQIAGLM